MACLFASSCYLGPHFGVPCQSKNREPVEISGIMDIVSVFPIFRNGLCINRPSDKFILLHMLDLRYHSPKHCATPFVVKDKSSCAPLEEYSDTASEPSPAESSEETSSQKMEGDELRSFLLDSERARLMRRLSEANAQYRFLKRQLLMKEDALVACQCELAALDLEFQGLIEIVKEMASTNTQQNALEVTGKYAPSFLLARLKAFQAKFKKQSEGIDAVKYRDVNLLWFGVAEMVQVMGSFDGWSLGEPMSPEYMGDLTKFTATIKLRPGRYEIKFLVDGEWQVSPELPVVGEAMMKNNLLTVE